MFMNGQVDIDDEELAQELSSIKYKFTRRGKIQIESKEELKKRLGKSPDKADCMMLAYAEVDMTEFSVVNTNPDPIDELVKLANTWPPPEGVFTE